MESSAISEVEGRLELTGLSAAVGDACAAGPEPRAALQRAAEVLTAAAQADPSRLASAWQRDKAELVRVVAVLSGHVGDAVAHLSCPDNPDGLDFRHVFKLRVGKPGREQCRRGCYRENFKW